MASITPAVDISYDGKLHIAIILVYRKPSLSPEQFYDHWYNIHGPLAIPLLKRYGVVHCRQACFFIPRTWFRNLLPLYYDLTSQSNQIHTTPAAKGLLNPILAPGDGPASVGDSPAIAADGIVMFYVKDWELFQGIFKDPEYLGPLASDEATFVETGKLEMTVGFEMTIIWVAYRL